jgi:pimeloyl-ACP methyl ester carboxylesterase
MTGNAILLPRGRPSSSQELAVRGLRYNVRMWGDPDAPPLVALHGIQDSSAAFQFVVDCLRQEWCVIAPDWRGHGHTQWARSSYWFHDFLADLDALLDTFFPGRPVPVVGHSLGANVASLLAGLRPGRLTHLVSLDGFGPPLDLFPPDARSVMARLLDNETAMPEPDFYGSVEEMANRMRKRNPQLPIERAMFLAEQSSIVEADGRLRWLYDPRVRILSHSLRSLAEWGEVWSGIRVPVLWLSCSDPAHNMPAASPADMEQRLRLMPGVQHRTIPGTTHNLHHEAPAEIASAVEAFLSGQSDGKG